LGSPDPNQCEVTYVNPILSGKGWRHHGEIGRVLRIGPLSEELPEFEQLRLAERHIMRNPDGEFVGRLHIELQPGKRVPDGTPAILLTLTARGAPMGDGLEGIMDFFDAGRREIVRGFAAITTSQMHKIWERIDE
jgi:hypothetical protein